MCAQPLPPHVVNKPQHYTLVSWAIDHGFWRVPSLAACMPELDQITDIVVTQSNRKSGESGVDTQHTQSHTHNISKLFDNLSNEYLKTLTHTYTDKDTTLHTLVGV